MRSRGFNKRIAIWQTTTSRDRFGGNVVASELLSFSWANVKTLSGDSASKDLEFVGLQNVSNRIQVTMRKRRDIDFHAENMFISYGTNQYVIESFVTDPNFEDSFLVFTAVRNKKDFITEQPIIS